MKLATILNARQSISFAYGLRLKSGARAYRLRKMLLAMDEELKAFDGMRNDFLKGRGVDRLSPGDEGFDELVKMLEEAAAEEVGVKIEPIIEMLDLDSTEASASDIDGLFMLGLIKDDQTADDTARTAEKIKP